ncbi:hypothetical protein F511_34267 [Dorcoceras hygrometricum]|uniref:CCHC-type domain-containing protein n=1 Tax=Dorcoceras hygrometricum TaxID=472368 RepID=A0A2Z7DEG6_9LAMI|nr:hypothetical protein F511_34267 [Dorcoceras hygrometricum]
MVPGVQPSQSVQSSQPPQQQQIAQQSGHQRFMPRGRQFKKKSSSSSSGSGSSSSGSSKIEYCGQCGGRHPTAQCVVVQGSCNVCGQYGYFARVCPLSGSQHTIAPPQGRGGSSRGRSFPAPQQRDTASRGPTTIVAPESQFRTCPTDHDSIGYPRMSASGESSTTMHRLLHASGSHPIPPPDDPKSLLNAIVNHHTTQ